jgi:pyruvate dehydrogenase E2 component (dihydrolipoamide acetyltransferase)
MPRFSFNQEESEIMEWLKQNGDKVEKDDPIAVVSTDKISMEVEAPESGILDGIRYKVGDVVPVTEIIAFILQPGEKVPEVRKAAPAAAKEISKTQHVADEQQADSNLVTGSDERDQVTKEDEVVSSGKVKATPAARRIAKEKGIELSGIAGSGPGGRIQVVDLEQAQAAAARPASTAAVLEEIPLVGMRRTIAQTMQRSKQEVPHTVLDIDVEMDAADALRKLANQNKDDSSPKVSVTAVIVKAVAWALKQNPIVNSQFAGDKILIMKDVNIGIATALDNGLIVPVIHNADQKDLTQISIELKDLAEKARTSRLQPDDLMGGTFTISNLGMMGVDRFSAIIYQPQAAILAVGKMKRVFIPNEHDQPVLRKIVTFSISADHRVMDGAQAAKFLSDLNEGLNQIGEIIK